MGIGGIYEYDYYQMKHPHHSASEQNSQGTELFIGIAKQWSRMKGNGHFEMIDLLSEHFDMIGTCAVYNGQVNFEQTLSKLNLKHLLVCEEPLTSSIEKYLESKMSPMMKMFVELLINYNIGDITPDIITRVYSRLELRAYKLKEAKIVQLMKNIASQKIQINVDRNSEEYKQAERQVKARKSR